MISRLAENPTVFDRQLSTESRSLTEERKTSFASLLNEAVGAVNNLQLEADRATQALALGEIDDVHSVTIATAKADLALQLTIQVRNRVVDAYQEIMRMQV